MHKRLFISAIGLLIVNVTMKKNPTFSLKKKKKDIINL